MSPPTELSNIKGDTDKPKFVGGQISKFGAEWRKITSDSWLLNSIQGVSIPFVELPIQSREPQPYRLSEEESASVDTELLKFLEKGVVQQVQPLEGQVISNIFLRPKKDGGHRLILDLTWVNLHIEYEHFKMHSLQTALNMVRRNCWMGSIDLRDAYYSVPVNPEHTKFLRFRWRNNLYEFRVLPNGLACAPRFFTKILSPVFAILREEGLEGFPYIDDSFVVSDDFETCERSLHQLSDTLEKLGFVIHETKSVMIPTQELVFLGFVIDSQEFKVYLTRDKEEKMVRAAEDILRKKSPTIREVAGILGLMTAFSQAFRYAEAYGKALDRDKVEALREARGDFRARMVLSEGSRRGILWWLRNVERSGRPVRETDPVVTLFTDASNEGWGAHLEDRTAGGRWTEQEKEAHINVLELKAILFGLKALCELEDTHIKILTDNTTALAYVKHHGGVRSEECDRVAQEIWEWAEDRQVWLSIAHIPGADNKVADFKSRNFEDNLEWQLGEKVFRRIVDRFGEPEIDLFATRLNCKVLCFVSWQPDPEAWLVDAFAWSWTGLKFYAFPPFSMVGKVVEKILEDDASGVLVVPWWPSQPWWGRLISLRLPHLRFRPKKKKLIPSGSPDNDQLLNNCPLGAFHFMGRHS